MQELGMQQSMSAVQSCPPIKQQAETNPPLSAQSTVSPPPRHCATYEHCAPRGNSGTGSLAPQTPPIQTAVPQQAASNPHGFPW
jgi:hypothetical protein